MIRNNSRSELPWRKRPAVQHGPASALAVLAVTLAASAADTAGARLPGPPPTQYGLVSGRFAGAGRGGLRRVLCAAPRRRNDTQQHAISSTPSHHSSPNAISTSPIGIVIICLPRLRNVIGLANTRSPPLNHHSSLPRPRVQGVEVPTRRGREHEVASRREHAGPGRRQDAVLPLDFAGLRIHGDRACPSSLRAGIARLLRRRRQRRPHRAGIRERRS